jgi:hypothetical protein
MQTGLIWTDYTDPADALPDGHRIGFNFENPRTAFQFALRRRLVFRPHHSRYSSGNGSSPVIPRWIC